MTIRDIRLFGDPILSTTAQAITVFDSSLQLLARDMLETMEHAGGVGLAANQIGIAKRIFVYDCSHVNPGMRGVLVNPVWKPVGEQIVQGTEGCLSIPGISASTPRFHQVSVRGQDECGRPVGLVVSGLMARCVQHETDHLDGVLFLQRLAAPERKLAMAKVHQAPWFSVADA
ncbi:peptide deformylase [Corynebacterium lizhenjunii]|nr:peptide deformylase [Corynebacterium lizhenjunii]